LNRAPHRAYHLAHLARAATVLALGVGAGLAGCERKPAATEARPDAAALPSIALAPGDVARLTRLSIDRLDDSEGVHPARLKITLERRGDTWALTAPIAGEASRPAVDETARNLETLRLWKLLDAGTRYYDQYDLTDDKAMRITAWVGERKVVDIFCGKGAQEGQLVRLPDRDGMFALINWGPQGYGGFLFTRALRDWRETAIFRFDDADVAAIEIRNPSGLLRFERHGAGWSATRARPGGAPRPWTTFDVAKIGQLLRDTRTLSADEFADGVSHADAGVEDAERIGGVLRIERRRAGPLTLRVGKLAHDTTRFGLPDSRWATSDGGDGTLYVLSPYTSGWALADSHKFE
jgi:hypothetical protein